MARKISAKISLDLFVKTFIIKPETWKYFSVVSLNLCLKLEIQNIKGIMKVFVAFVLACVVLQVCKVDSVIFHCCVTTNELILSARPYQHLRRNTFHSTKNQESNTFQRTKLLSNSVPTYSTGSNASKTSTTEPTQQREITAFLMLNSSQASTMK